MGLVKVKIDFYSTDAQPINFSDRLKLRTPTTGLCWLTHQGFGLTIDTSPMFCPSTGV